MWLLLSAILEVYTIGKIGISALAVSLRQTHDHDTRGGPSATNLLLTFELVCDTQGGIPVRGTILQPLQMLTRIFGRSLLIHEFECSNTLDSSQFSWL